MLRGGWQERASWWGRQQQPAAARQCLWGATAFGDNVEDEWFIVWLLLELTKLHPGTIARQAPNAVRCCRLSCADDCEACVYLKPL